ncbi:MAG TPA: HAMP domain-containing sensor histidine kinase [Symbiobacteriaceae bacterium]|nr:HAMP domain-containing sensor histidine kinase [Symbiobacteriaceae bacterium]
MRLATRLALSYIGFVALLTLLVLILAGIQLTRLANRTSSLPAPASGADAAEIAKLLATEGLDAPIPPAALSGTLDAGGWLQVLDVDGREVRAVAAPPDRLRSYAAVQLADLAQSMGGQGSIYYEMEPVRDGETLRGIVILAAPNEAMVGIRLASPAMRFFWSYFFTGVGMAIMAAVVLALLAGFWYARRLAGPLTRLSRELAVAAAGDFSHRILVEGKDEIAALTRAYNNLVERLAAAQEQRSRMEQARRDLVANISHDLRTPLTSIQGFTEAMASDDTASEARKRYARIIADRIRALDGLLGDLLELSRLQAVPAVKREPVDLPELIREQLIALMPEVEKAGLEIEVDLPEDLPPIPVDARLMGRALQNLLTNAVRHSGGARRIGVSLAPSGAGVAVVVYDDGRGIPQAELPMLFERYYQGTSPTNKKRGVGLGLAIVRQIAENHGGRITVETAEGAGTAFTLWLPMSG